MKKKILPIILLLFTLHLHAQKEAAIWHFGYFAGLDFNSGSPVALIDGQLITAEGCASIANSDGELLFYTDGITVYNADHVQMLNGDGLLGHDSSTQSAIIIPKPNDPYKYYIFAVDYQANPNGLTYSLVDMTLDGGLGGVVTTEKNIQLHTPVCEKLTAVYHENKQDIWVIAHRANSDKFLAYLVTETGVNISPVESNVGVVNQAGAGTLGYLKASPNGKKIASGISYLTPGLELFDFDNSTGVISNPIELNDVGTYGVEFSPDSNFLYATIGTGSGLIYQYDLTVPEDEMGDEVWIASFYMGNTALQLGIDGKIYCGSSTTALSVINNPNGAEAACDYQQLTVDLNGMNCALGLPPFITSYFQFEIIPDGFCTGIPTVFEIETMSNIVSSEWDFGDPDSESNTSSDLVPAHSYNQPGTYTITVDIVTDVGYEITLTKEITIIASPIANEPNDMEACDTIPNDGFASFSLISQSIEILDGQIPAENPVTYYTTEDAAIAGEEPLPAGSFTNTVNPQTIYARITNNETGCYDITSFDLIVNLVPTITDPDDLLACEEEQGEGIAVFDLTEALPQITGGNDQLDVVFYGTASNMLNNMPITTPQSYSNTTPYSETIYFKASDADAPECTATGDLNLVVNALPVLNTGIVPYYLCDSNNTGDGTEIFDLTTKYSEVTNEPGLTLTYSYEQAGDLVTIEDPTAFQNTVANQQTIYVSTENVYTCDNITSFDIVVGQFPDIDTNFDPFLACEDQSGLGNFNLGAITPIVTDSQNGLTVFYYTTEEAAHDGGEELDTPYLTGNTTIYARIVAVQTGCVVIAAIPLEVIPSPVAETPDPLEECDLDNNGVATFNLDPVLEQIAADMGNVTVTIYETEDDAIYEGTQTPNPGTYNNIATADPNQTGYQTLWIRVAPNTTEGNGCFDIVPLQLIIHPAPVATELTEPFEMCDNGADDTDGQAIFDLATLEEAILGDLDPAQHTITFHDEEAEAWAGTPTIPTPASWPSENNFVYARVTDNDTGCFDVVEIELIVNPLPQANEPTPMTLCDEDPGDPEQEVFDLTTKIPEIIEGQEGLDVTFHFEYDEAVANVNAVTDPYNYVNEPTVETLFVRVTNAETGCYGIVLLDVRVAPLPVVQMPTVDDLTTCDTDGNGIAEFDLDALVDDMINNAPEPLVITFHETPENAQSGEDPIPNPESYFNNVPYEQDIWVRVVNTDTGCYNTSDIVLHLTVVAAPQAPALEDITLCDDEDDHGQDGFAFVDLTVQNPAIEEATNSDPGELTIHYFTTEDNANAGAPRITVPEHFYATNEQWIWVRVEDPVSECFSISSFQVFLNEPLLLETPSPLTLCNTALPNDAQETFDLTTKDDEILGELGIGQGFTVEYFESQADVDDNNPIDTPQAYTNTTNPKTLFVVVTTDQGCRSYTTLTIRVLPLPVPDTDPDPLVLCDDNGNGDGFEEFDLTDAEWDIRDNDFQSVITYHTSLDDAEAGINPIATPEAYVSGNATIWVRMEANTTNPDDPKCYQVVELQLQVTPLPGIGDNPVYAQCEPNTDGLHEFHLKEFIENILGEGADENYDITFYLDQAAMDAGTAMPVIYTNEQNPQTILVHVEDLITGCEITSPMTLIVEEAAVANPVTGDNNPMIECDDDEANDGFHEFDLTAVEAEVLGTQDPDEYTVTYYLTEEDAIAAANAITNPDAFTNATALGQTIWVNVMHTGSISQCSDVTSFGIVVELLPEPVITTEDGNNTICVDYITQEVLRSLILDSGVESDGHTYDWYLNDVLIASTDTRTYEATKPGLYTVQVTSANDCVSLLSAEFEVIQSGPASPVGTGYYVTEAFSDEQTITVLVEGYGEYEYRLDEDGMWQTSNVFVDVAPGAHTVYVRDVLTDFGCETLVLSGVSVIDYPRFFTPNGDGFHDTWNIIGLDGTGSVIYIFDRYGKLMKQISPDDESTGWDGTYNGTPVPATDYWFTVEYPEYVGDAVMIKEFKAHFSLKR